jgi:predicted ArsR family transcriptional regulator
MLAFRQAVEVCFPNGISEADADKIPFLRDVWARLSAFYESQSPPAAPAQETATRTRRTPDTQSQTPEPAPATTTGTTPAPAPDGVPEELAAALPGTAEQIAKRLGKSPNAVRRQLKRLVGSGIVAHPYSNGAAKKGRRELMYQVEGADALGQ